jgi:hypothetical protein
MACTACRRDRTTIPASRQAITHPGAAQLYADT